MSEKDSIIKASESLGKALVSRAMEETKNEKIQHAVDVTKRSIALHNEHEEMVRRHTLAMQFYKDKIAAIESGEFQIDQRNGAIIFNDEQFNHEFNIFYAR